MPCYCLFPDSQSLDLSLKPNLAEGTIFLKLLGLSNVVVPPSGHWPGLVLEHVHHFEISASLVSVFYLPYHPVPQILGSMDSF